MANRNGINQSKHDRKVGDIAIYYHNRGYEVYADIYGWAQPALRNGYRPDVVAKKGYCSVIVEVETKDSVRQDQTQINAFRSYARRYAHVHFKLVVV